MLPDVPKRTTAKPSNHATSKRRTSDFSFITVSISLQSRRMSPEAAIDSPANRFDVVLPAEIDGIDHVDEQTVVYDAGNRI